MSVSTMNLHRASRVTTAQPGRVAHAIAFRPSVSLSTSSRLRTRHICNAEADKTPTPATQAPQEQQSQQEVQQAAATPPSAPLLAPGQGTAIVTGAISIIFGIAYLVLVSILDMRGGELQPPPPEAFMQ